MCPSSSKDLTMCSTWSAAAIPFSRKYVLASRTHWAATSGVRRPVVREGRLPFFAAETVALVAGIFLGGRRGWLVSSSSSENSNSRGMVRLGSGGALARVLCCRNVRVELASEGGGFAGIDWLNGLVRCLLAAL